MKWYVWVPCVSSDTMLLRYRPHDSFVQFGNLAKQDYDDKMDESWGNAANDPWATLNMRSNIPPTPRTYVPAHSVSLSSAKPPSVQSCINSC